MRGHRIGIVLPDFARHFGGSPPRVPASEAQPQRTDPDIQRKEADARLRARKRKGRQSTILGGETAPEDAVDKAQKELLGG